MMPVRARNRIESLKPVLLSRPPALRTIILVSTPSTCMEILSSTLTLTLHCQPIKCGRPPPTHYRRPRARRSPSLTRSHKICPTETHNTEQNYFQSSDFCTYLTLIRVLPERVFFNTTLHDIVQGKPSYMQTYNIHTYVNIHTIDRVTAPLSSPPFPFLRPP